MLGRTVVLTQSTIQILTPEYNCTDTLKRNALSASWASFSSQIDRFLFLATILRTMVLSNHPAEALTISCLTYPNSLLSGFAILVMQQLSF